MAVKDVPRKIMKRKVLILFTVLRKEAQKLKIASMTFKREMKEKIEKRRDQTPGKETKALSVENKATLQILLNISIPSI